MAFSDTPRTDAHDNVGTAAAVSEGMNPPSLSELPFLVTHWLANYQGEEGDPQREEVIERLRNATSEMAAAFSDLGAYGTSSRPTFRSMDMQLPTRNATYGDMVRRWQPVPPSHLESLVQAAASATVASESVASRASTNLLLAAQESQRDADGGRRLTDGPQLATAVPVATSMLQSPALLGPSKESDGQIVPNVTKHDELSLAIESDSSRLGEAAGKAMRGYLSLREDHEKADIDITRLKKEVLKQQRLKEELENERVSILAGGNEAAAEHVGRLNQIAEGLLNTDRLIPQHMNSLTKLEEAQRTRTEKLGRAKQVSQSLYSKLSTTMKRFRDPSHQQKFPSVPVRVPTCRENSSFFDTITRQYGGSWGPRLPKRIQGGTPSDASAAETRKSILAKRLAYSMTASAHLAFPVFCLCFDKTGRFFVTGADDCLVKLFYIGAARSKATTQRTFCYGSNDRSAVLVCTFRGHAGVICDIDISSDNAFLATASDDGDCRVWGLKDGSPIAILRGHKDGANMVSWSELTPYRLVTTGSDGLSRMWDIREAAINRYGAHVGKRSDYTLPSTDNGRSADGSEAAPRAGASSGILASGDELLPPLPLRNDDSFQDGPGLQGNRGTAAENFVEGEGNAAAGAQDGGAVNVQQGQFVRNDVVDEGVRLVTKLQHGAPPDESLPGASTRSRRKAVRVICVARCPRGGHFATGAEDGICRVWSEEDGGDVIAKQDAEHSANYFQSGQRTAERRSTRVQQQSEGRLLAELTGHVNSITDLHYSHAGDRILTASQKDGVARVWSWTESHVDGSGGRFENVKQILLQVKKPGSLASTGAPSRRRAAADNASCDVAIWTADDSRIVTSQCCVVKEGSAEIVEGSQYLLVWDSRNGQCLLGISAAHNAQVPVLIPHPTISTLLCSAGGDGIAKLWDLEKGQCLHMHENKILDIGPVAESSGPQRKYSGYLDGSFSPDGLSLVLTDDSGRFTLFSVVDSNSDSLDKSSREASSRLRRSSSSNQARIPSWMKEQYFANDYYELYFDTNGYCVERGSGQPPHLAPRSVRCSFTGSPWAEEVNDVFSRLRGPIPLSEDICRRNRDEIRYHSFLSETGTLPENNRANLISYFDPRRTVLIDGKSSSVVTASDLPSLNETASQPPHAAGHGNERHGAMQRSRSPNARNLSSNYRWRGYDDIMAEEAAREEEEDANDDDYVAPAARPSAVEDDLSDDVLMTDSDGSEDSPRVTRRRASSSRSGRSRRRRRVREQALSYEERSRARPTRVSARQLNRTQPEHYEAESDSDSFVEAFLSTNNSPSGPHLEDYTVAGHYFKLPDSGRVKRQWLLRTENRTSHNGIKDYAPQAGDSVVYIPRAHYETLKMFPTLDAPWKHFERGARWPVVRCSVKDIRYRFPYQQYYRSQNEARCLSVVAILTLEVTGIPSLSGDEIFPWPRPSFVERQTRGQVFEVSMFESDCPEFVIPEALFTWRLQSIENSSGRTRHQNELPVVAYFSVEDTTRLRSGSNREDQEMVAYPGTLMKLLPNSEREPDDHLLSSGYGTLEVKWDSGGDPDILSPWEVSLQDKAYETPSPPTLSTAATRAIANALAKIEARPEVEEYFLHPVDESRYPDYRNRVEVPMTFSFIKERLAAGYYSNVRSVLSDAKLISDNCMKYNGPSDLSQAASDIYDSFEDEVKSHVDMDESLGSASMSLVAGDSAPVHDDLNDSSRASRLARRQRQETSTRASRLSSSEDGGTSLERLPSPGHRASSSRTRRLSATEPSRRRTRGRPERDSAASSRVTRSGSSRPVMAEDSHGNSMDESNVVESEAYDDDDSFSGDQEEQGGDDSSEDLSESDDGNAPGRSSRRPSRKSSTQRVTRKSGRAKIGPAKAAGISSSDEWEEGQKYSSEDEEEESEVSPPPSRRSRRQLSTPESHENERRTSPRRSTRAALRSAPDGEDVGTSRSTRATRRSTRPSSLAGGTLDSPRRSTRAHESRTMADLSHSDFDEDESENEDDSESEDVESEEEEPQVTVKRRGALKRRSVNTPAKPAAAKRRKTSTPRSSPRRASGRRTRGGSSAKSMADLSDSGVEDGRDYSSEEEEAPRKTARKRAASKRTKDNSSESPRASKRARPQRKTKSKEEFPEIKPWPAVDLKAITQVSKAVLKHLALLDEYGLFAVPVIEQAPELEDVYLSTIESPMDFRTIKEDRVQYYASIQELQDDLILVFRNCATFNDPSSEYHAFAITIWEQVNDVFRNVCKEQDVMLPRRW